MRDFFESFLAEVTTDGEEFATCDCFCSAGCVCDCDSGSSE